jgi:hypothetical protein
MMGQDAGPVSLRYQSKSTEKQRQSYKIKNTKNNNNNRQSYMLTKNQDRHEQNP